ncbi:Hypothetical predicted protein [Lecanosticta acicola]|uniref:Uncharacterized protein n=1 Tax=Lecanosticta acicola TaxID=111012 RepID=A0AAI8Z2P6_9PEZI|nr:Hypothetical predicted protein [Lecanosticta acicola]
MSRNGFPVSTIDITHMPQWQIESLIRNLVSENHMLEVEKQKLQSEKDELENKAENDYWLNCANAELAAERDDAIECSENHRLEAKRISKNAIMRGKTYQSEAEQLRNQKDALVKAADKVAQAASHVDLPPALGSAVRELKSEADRARN